MAKVSIIIPGRTEHYFQQTVDSVLASATGDIEVIAVVDGDEAEPKVQSNDPRVKIIRLDKSIGQRAAYNLGVRESTGKYVMKIDAHAKLSKGFDEVLQSHCPKRAVVLPEMRRLDVKKWEHKPRGKTHFMYIGLDLYCHFWNDYRRRPEAQVKYPEVMNGQGSCWFTTRVWNDYIGLLDEGVGSWGNVGIEVSLRTWLCGGMQIVNKQTWQAHWFRRDDGGFTYPMSGRQVARAHRYTKENYYFKDNAFKHQVRPFRWLIEKFAPVPGWEIYLSDDYKAPRVIIYYTDHHIEESLGQIVRKQLAKAATNIPIISVSHKPLNFGKNICTGVKPRSNLNIYEQIYAGLKAAPEGSIIYLCEHDVIYHTSHFAFLPKHDDQLYYNQNRFHWGIGQPNYLPARGKWPLSQLVARREFLLKEIEKILATGEMPSTVINRRTRSFTSAKPNVDIRHGKNFSKNGRWKKEYYAGTSRYAVANIAHWGSPRHFAKRIGYKGVLRTDIINYLITQNNYGSYLEIGIDRGDNWKYITCPLKHGIDPDVDCTSRMTSDEFFAKHCSQAYDLIFIDGLHESTQVSRDLENSLQWLNPGGVIVMHDCNPRNLGEQLVPRRRGQNIWTGDAWKAFVSARRRSDLEMYTVDTNNGVGIVRRGSQVPLDINDSDLVYENLVKHRAEWLNLKSVDWFKKAELRCMTPA